MRHLPTILAVLAGVVPPTTLPEVGKNDTSDAWLRLAALLAAIVLHVLQAKREQRRARRRNRPSRN